jgi:inorganic pyrophosphatase
MALMLQHLCRSDSVNLRDYKIIKIHAFRTILLGEELIDSNEADDKIIAVLKGDALYGDWNNIDQCPRYYNQLLEQLVFGDIHD